MGLANCFFKKENKVNRTLIKNEKCKIERKENKVENCKFHEMRLKKVED